MKSNELTGRIENWWCEQTSRKEFVICGDLFDDAKGRFSDGWPIHTSGILNRSVKEGDVVETRNSVYLLGKQKQTTRTHESIYWEIHASIFAHYVLMGMKAEQASRKAHCYAVEHTHETYLEQFRNV